MSPHKKRADPQNSHHWLCRDKRANVSRSKAPYRVPSDRMLTRSSNPAALLLAQRPLFLEDGTLSFGSSFQLHRRALLKPKNRKSKQVEIAECSFGRSHLLQ